MLGVEEGVVGVGGMPGDGAPGKARRVRRDGWRSMQRTSSRAAIEGRDDFENEGRGECGAPSRSQSTRGGTLLACVLGGREPDATASCHERAQTPCRHLKLRVDS
jgi:hypothetical protein